MESDFKIHHPVTCLRQASSFACTFGADSFVPPLLSRRGVVEVVNITFRKYVGNIKAN